MGVRPVVVAGLESDIGRVGAPIAARDHEADAIDVMAERTALYSVRVGEAAIAEWTPWPRGGLGVVIDRDQAVRCAVAVFLREREVIWHDAIEERAVAEVHVRAVRPRSLDEKIEEAADAGLCLGQIFAGGLAPHRG